MQIEPDPTLLLQKSKTSDCPEEDNKVTLFEMSRSPTGIAR